MNQLLRMIERQAEHKGLRDAIRYRDDATGTWEGITWSHFNTLSKEIALAMHALGVKTGDRIGLFSPNMPEMLITDFAAMRNRAIPVPIYSTLEVKEVQYIIDDAGIELLFVGAQEHYERARKLSGVHRIVVYDRTVKLATDDHDTIYFHGLYPLGHAADAAARDEVAKRTAEGAPTDLACLIYTSGTTGDPKGVMLPHSCFDSQMESHLRRLSMLSDGDLAFSFLPLSHVFERGWVYFCLTRGMTVALNRNPRDVMRNLREVNPNAMSNVPRFWEKVYIAINDKIKAMNWAKKLFVKYAELVGRIRNIRYLGSGRQAPMLIEQQYRFLEKAVFRQLRRVIGVERGKLFPTAGAKISDDIVRFLQSVGINICVGYGLSETTATVSCFPPTGYKIGSIGLPLESVSVKIGDNNEILVKGPTVTSGYYRNPEATAAAFTPDGYFRTGDAGSIDAQGNLYITDRIKDLFKTSNGKYIAPQQLETLLPTDRYIEQVAIIGDQRKFVSALVVPNFDNLRQYAEEEGIQATTDADLAGSELIHQMISQRIDRMQEHLASYQQVKRFTLLSRPFSVENGELTNTLKLRRAVVNKNFRREIEEMYKE